MSGRLTHAPTIGDSAFGLGSQRLLGRSQIVGIRKPRGHFDSVSDRADSVLLIPVCTLAAGKEWPSRGTSVAVNIAWLSKWERFNMRGSYS